MMVKNEKKRRASRSKDEKLKKKNDKKLVICIQYRKSVSILYLFNITTSFYIMSFIQGSSGKNESATAKKQDNQKRLGWLPPPPPSQFLLG